MTSPRVVTVTWSPTLAATATLAPASRARAASSAMAMRRPDCLELGRTTGGMEAWLFLRLSRERGRGMKRPAGYRGTLRAANVASALQPYQGSSPMPGKPGLILDRGDAGPVGPAHDHPRRQRDRCRDPRPDPGARRPDQRRAHAQGRPERHRRDAARPR